MHDDSAIPALLPRGSGHQFVFLGDACSGVPGAPHERALAATTEVIRKLDPGPEFVIFAGDEIRGLTSDEGELRAQWQHWLDSEMAWLDRDRTPLYQTTSNHTTYDAVSERVYADVLRHLPQNGPRGLAWHARHRDLLLIGIHTSDHELGGEGHVETEWLAQTLASNADARYKFVVGHHPVWPVNGFSGEHVREIAHDDGQHLWRLFIQHGVTAYLCSHILAWDAQVHSGVLQLLSAGAGTLHRMPEGIEYLHFAQIAVDDAGLRAQVLDHDGAVRETVQWPPLLPESDAWLPIGGHAPGAHSLEGRAWRLRGITAADGHAAPQTLLAASGAGTALAPFRVELTGVGQRLTVLLAPEAGRSPHYWFGPELGAGYAFDLQLAVHAGMGPGGVLFRITGGDTWTSLASASPWGPERLPVEMPITIGHGPRGSTYTPFAGTDLSVTTCEIG